MYTERNYVTELRARVAEFLAQLDEELVKQSRRPNRESERRTRKLLLSFARNIARPYKRDSLSDLASSPESHNEGV